MTEAEVLKIGRGVWKARCGPEGRTRRSNVLWESQKEIQQKREEVVSLL